MPLLRLRDSLVLLVLLLAPVPGRGEAPLVAPAAEPSTDQVVVEFRTTFELPNTRRSVFLVGDHSSLGGGDVTRAIRMVSDDRLHWRIAVAFPPGAEYEFRYVTRNVRPSLLSDPTNAAYLTEPASGRTPPGPRTERGKLLQVRSDFLHPLLHWREVGGELESVALTDVGPGRHDGERLFEVRDFAPRGRRLELYLTDGAELDRRGTRGAVALQRRDPPTGAYSTELDSLFLQDRQVFTYVPAARVSAPRRDYDPASPPFLRSSVLGKTRPYRVFLPRGYDSHPERRYPVLYVVDGQSRWEGGISWDPNGLQLADLVDRGEVGELIVVAVDNLGTGCARTRNRLEDMISPEDSLDLSTTPGACRGVVLGHADLFLTFLVDELKPRIDVQYRTLPDREHTFASGFSLGGVYAVYAGWEFNDWFAAVGSQSGSFWIPNFPARVVDEPRKELRLYLDFGDQEASPIYATVEALRDGLVDLDSDFVIERDLRLFVGFGQNHNNADSGKRLEPMLTFLWPATRRVSELR